MKTTLPLRATSDQHLKQQTNSQQQALADGTYVVKGSALCPAGSSCSVADGRYYRTSAGEAPLIGASQPTDHTT